MKRGFVGGGSFGEEGSSGWGFVGFLFFPRRLFGFVRLISSDGGLCFCCSIWCYWWSFSAICLVDLMGYYRGWDPSVCVCQALFQAWLFDEKKWWSQDEAGLWTNRNTVHSHNNNYVESRLYVTNPIIYTSSIHHPSSMHHHLANQREGKGRVPPSLKQPKEAAERRLLLWMDIGGR